MELPEKIDILGITYEIRLVDVIDHNPNLVGHISCPYQTIQIKASLPDDQKMQTFIHEVLHGIDEGLGFPLNSMEDEQLVQQIATGFNQTFGRYIVF